MKTINAQLVDVTNSQLDYVSDEKNRKREMIISEEEDAVEKLQRNSASGRKDQILPLV